MTSHRQLPLYDAPEPIMREAGAWLAKKDRGFSPEETSAFDRWRMSDRSHQAAVDQLKATMTAFDRVAELAPDFSPAPDPDALAPVAPRRSLRWLWLSAAAIAAAAAVAMIFFHTDAPQAPTVQRYATAAGGYERVTLADGSVIDLNGGSVLEVEYSTFERQVRLSRGEAHFQVAKNPERPFVVTAGAVSVRAVGTAFNVHLGADQIAVLVTEGRVALSQTRQLNQAYNTQSSPESSRLPVPRTTLLSAGERAVVSFAQVAPMPQVVPLTRSEIEQQLAWQPRLLELRQTPLSAIVAELNAHAPAGRPRLVIDDPDLAALQIGGNFRADQADAFVRLLETSFDVTAERSADTITLRRAR